MRASAARGRLLVAACSTVLALCCLMAVSSPAGALIHRGHEFAGAFGEGDLSSPSGVAVNEATGDVYVLDAGHNRVVHYGPKHEFLQAWGAGVKTAGAKEYEVCTPEHNLASECAPTGTAGFGKGQFDEPVAIAIDNSSASVKSPSRGDVYVVANSSAKKAVIDKFSPSGTLITRLEAGKEEREEFEENRILGVAVAPTGTVWIDREGEEAEVLIQRLGNGEKNTPVGVPADIEPEQLAGPARPGFAIDGKGGVYVTYEPEGHTLEEQEEEEEEIKEEKTHAQPQLPCERHPCLVVKLNVTEVGEELEGTVAANPVVGENSAGVAVDLSHGTQSAATPTSTPARAWTRSPPAGR